MKHILDKESKSFLQFRRKDLRRELQSLENIISGRETDFVTYIEKQFGEVTDESLELLIQRMLDSLKSFKEADSIGTSWNRLSDEQIEFYECFLYCTMQAAAWVEDFSTMLIIGNFEEVRTFADIVNMAKDPDTICVKSREVLLNNEFWTEDMGTVENGFFGICNECYRLITGKSITENYSETEQNKMKAEIDAAFQAQVASYEADYLERALAMGFQSAEELAKYEQEQEEKEALEAGFETVEEYYQFLNEESMTEEDRQYVEDACLWEQELHSKQNKWLSNLLNPDRFIKKYLRYRELYFEVNFKALPLDIENMVDAFLYEQGISGYSLGDDYGMISYRLEKVQDRIRNEIRKAGNYDTK